MPARVGESVARRGTPFFRAIKAERFSPTPLFYSECGVPFAPDGRFMFVQTNLYLVFKKYIQTRRCLQREDS